MTSKYNFPGASGNFIGIGDNAHGVYHASPDPLPQAIAQLRTALAGNRALLTDPDGAERALAGVEAELRQPSPAPGRIGQFLHAITAAAPTVTAGGAAVQALAAAVRA